MIRENKIIKQRKKITNYLLPERGRKKKNDVTSIEIKDLNRITNMEEKKLCMSFESYVPILKVYGHLLSQSVVR
jgi:hypothetical protein